MNHNILLIGSGGREHALAWKISQSPFCQQLYIAPGNAGTALHGKNASIVVSDFDAIEAFVVDHNISMLIVGPEAPLVDGLWDHFQTKDHLKEVQFIGPSAQAAQLEGSKDFAKQFMAEFGIPTAAYQSFTADNIQQGFDFIDQQTPPIVLKADGLAAGKGVVILNDKKEAKAELEAMLKGKFGGAGNTVVIEQFLDGIECSVFVLSDGKNWKILPVAKDYKRIGEGDTGLNTGGMGAISPPPFVTDDIMEKVIDRVVKPTMKGIQSRDMVYKGFIFLGLILVNGDPFVIEYNCRMGDPETEVVIPRVQSDLVPIFEAIHNGTLDQTALKTTPQHAATVMLVSGGYPLAYEKGKVISGLNDVEASIVFHAGTRKENDEIRTNGGRVIAITSLKDNFREALDVSYQNAKKLNFTGKYYRSDIGFDL